MKPSSILIQEHCLIEQVLASLERMAERCESGRQLEGGPARDALRFLRGFAERCHCDKVEVQLLPTMRAMGISQERCLGGSILHRREEGRSHLAAMEAAIEPASAGDAPALDEFAEHARAYIELLLEYMAKQEDCLLPMITQALPEPDKTRLTRALAAACGDGQAERAIDPYVDLANRLADHFAVPRAVAAGPHGNRGAKERAE